ncbi:hypothetical protein [Hyalangium minutum]|uniref:Uncharacterized protein n=1 Tax=Hyalangium minutum TaxID=394096 RepID=A0A085WKU2_9BACT|nr:hypothetical protein [Hyalangium minutum]KFE68305.1 hypothetical protein DB31_7542 [Hyalangium minutum]
MFDPSGNDPISPALQDLLKLFGQELATVKFPELDRAVLEEAAERVKDKAAELAQAQAALEAARQALYESQEALLQKGQRALAYARIFAEEDAELSAKLDSISLPRPVRKALRAEGAPVLEAPSAQGEENAPRRRGRPPKARTSAPLFAEGASPELIAAVEAESANGTLHTA